MLTVNSEYNKYNNTFCAKIPTGKKISSHIRIHKYDKESYNVIADINRKFFMDIDNASIDEIGNMLKKKSSSLPETIDSLFYNTGLYMNGGVKQDNYIKYFCQHTEVLYRRIGEGKEKELFKESYSPEIKMITKIRNAINNTDTENNLDVVINKVSREYLKTPITRKKFFAV